MPAFLAEKQNVMQMSWDRLEAAAWLAAAENDNSAVNANGDDNDDGGNERGVVRKKAVLMQAGTGDAEVRVR